MASSGKTMPWWSLKTDPTGTHLFFALMEECRRRGYAFTAARAAWAKRTGEPCPFHEQPPKPEKAYLCTMANTAYLDLETRSTYDLQDVGVERYTEDPATDILCFCYALDDGPVKAWVRGQPFPADLAAHLSAGGKVQAHNAGFERWMWRVGVAKHQFPAIPEDLWECSMAACAAMAFPQSLDGAAKAFGGDDLKDDEGRRLMLKLCKPQGKAKEFVDPSEDQLARLVEYCAADVKAQRGLWSSGLAPLPRAEVPVWLETQRMNDRGVRIDLRAADGLVKLLAWSEKNLDEMVRAVVGRELNVRSPLAVKEWLASRSIHRETLDKEDVRFLLKLSNLPGDARMVLEARQQMSKSSTAKIQGMIDRACDDGRVRGNFRYHGATTGRWAAGGVQMQNLPKGDLDSASASEALDDAVEVSEGRMPPADWTMLWGDPFTVCPSLIRGLMIPSEGRAFVCADYSAIEGRVLAWLAGEEHVLDAYRNNLRLYAVAASGIYHVPYAEIMAGRDRGEKKYKTMDAVGKCIELACGYQGGVGAFNSMAGIFGVVVPEDEAKAAITAWRESRPKTVALWRSLEREAVMATQNPGYVGTVGLTRFRHDGKHLWMRLPSGRKLCYPFAKTNEKEVPWGGTKPQVSCMAMNSMTKKWEWDDYYGGKFCENLVQAVARDIMAEGFLRVAGLNDMAPLALVHDECLCEVVDTTDALDRLVAALTQLPIWADASLPLAAEGWIGERYCK